MDNPTIILNLSLPPSVNKLWSHPPGLKRRIRSPEYSTWLRVAGWEARRQLVGVPMILGNFNAQLTVPIKSRRDLDSWTKAIFDLCQHAGAVRNDSGLRAYSVDASDRTDCMVALWDLGGVPFAEPKRKAHAVSVPRKRFTKRDRKASAIYAKAFL